MERVYQWGHQRGKELREGVEDMHWNISSKAEHIRWASSNQLKDDEGVLRNWKTLSAAKAKRNH